MADWKIPADQLEPGMMFRDLGSGFIARRVTEVRPGTVGFRTSGLTDQEHRDRYVSIISDTLTSAYPRNALVTITDLDI